MGKILNKLDDFVYKRLIRNLMFGSRLGRKSTFGLADSGMNFDHIYQNVPKGYNKFGQFVDRLLLNLPACQATRNRFGHVVEVLKNEINKNRQIGKKTRIVDLASGPARYIIEALSSNSSDVECLCLDIDHRSLNYGKSLAEDKPILFKRANALFLGKHLLRFCKQKNWKPNLVIASGFYEYQPDEVVKKHFSKAYEYLEEGGLFLGILQHKNPNRKLIEKVGKKKNGQDWVLYYRAPSVVEQWLRQACFNEVSVERDRWGQYAFGYGRKVQ